MPFSESSRSSNRPTRRGHSSSKTSRTSRPDSLPLLPGGGADSVPPSGAEGRWSTVKAVTSAPAVTERTGLSVRERLRRLDTKGSPYVYVAPFFVTFAVFGAFPLLYTGYVSLTNRNLLNPVSSFVGLDNYAKLIHDSYFWNAVENTLGIWMISTIPQLFLALVLAHVLNTK